MDTSSFLPGTGTEARLAAMLRDFDRYLKSDALIEKMTLEEAAYVLDQIALFNTEADHGRLEIEMSAEANPRLLRVIAAGCRLTSDLVGKISSRMMDLLEASDHGLSRINKEMREHIRNRHLSTTLLHKAHAVRNDTQRTASSAGLGTIL